MNTDRELVWISNMLMGTLAGLAINCTLMATTWDRIDGKVELRQCTMIEHIMTMFRKKKMSDISSTDPLLQGIGKNHYFILPWIGYPGQGGKAKAT